MIDTIHKIWNTYCSNKVADIVDGYYLTGSLGHARAVGYIGIWNAMKGLF